MSVTIFQTHKFDRPVFEELNKKFKLKLNFLETQLNETTAILAMGSDVICCFANDKVGASTIRVLHEVGVKLIATRSAGYNHIDIAAAKNYDIPVVRVPEYSPHSVAEHAVALILSLNRRIPHAFLRVKELNFTLDGLLGFDIYQKTVGVIGVGKIGSAFAQIMHGFGAKVLGYDLEKNTKIENQGVLTYSSLEKIYQEADIISLHVPLTPKTKYIIDEKAIALMKSNVMLINTGRGSLIDSKALIHALKHRKIGYAGLDVYEEEEGIFFENLSEGILQDDTLARLLTFPNVLITSHQGFFTREALHNIVETTLNNIASFYSGSIVNQVR